MQEMFRHSGNFLMGAYTASTGVLSFDKVAANISPVGLMSLGRRFGTTPVAITGNSPQHEVKGTVNFDKPKVSSGSDTYPLDVSATFTPDRKALTIGIVNPPDRERQLGVTLRGVKLGFRGPSMEDRRCELELHERSWKAGRTRYRRERGK